jgi:hypothetical protein
MSEPQLERSVLEAKEREELYAIADALGTKPGSRAKKSDLIAQILRATGVEPEMAEPIEKPRRTRARKVAAPIAEAPDVAGEAAEAVDPEIRSDAAVAPVSRPGRRRAGLDEEQGRAASDSEQLALEANPTTGQDTQAPAGPSDRDATWAAASDGGGVATGVASNGSDAAPAATNGPVDGPPVGGGWNGGADASTTPAPESGHYRAPEAHGTNGAAESAPPRSGDFRSNRPQSDGRNGRPEGQGGYQPGPQSHGGQPQHTPQPANQQPGNQQPGGGPQGVPQPGPRPGGHRAHGARPAGCGRRAAASAVLR